MRLKSTKLSENSKYTTSTSNLVPAAIGIIAGMMAIGIAIQSGFEHWVFYGFSGISFTGFLLGLFSYWKDKIVS
jgi:uncharacterized membrane protein